MKKKKIWVLPNILTLLRIALSPVFLILFLQSKNTAGLIVFLIVAVTDLIDGALARRIKQKTEFGEFIDPMADKFMIILAVIALFIKFGFPLYGLWIFSRDIASLAGSILVHAKSKSNWKASKMGKATTFLQILTIGVFIIDSQFKYYILLLAMISSVLTAITYIRRGISISLSSK